MSRVDQGPKRSRAKKKKNPIAQRENRWEKDGGRMCRKSDGKAQRKKTGPRAQRYEQSARCG